jgi:mono/diheme cytochrome c family protein
VRWHSRFGRTSSLLLGLLLAAVSLRAQSGARPGYDLAYIGPPMADPVLQQSKETYIVMGCAYCHGMYLTPRGEAADLLRSPLVGADVNGNLLGPLLRAGVPKTLKLSPMPQYSDLSERQIADITRWIHYARQRARHQELTAAALPAGDAQAGRAYFDRNCAACHDAGRDLAGVAAGSEVTLRDVILEPKRLAGEPSYRVDAVRDARLNAGRLRHGALLENYSAEQVANLVAYLRTVKAR